MSEWYRVASNAGWQAAEDAAAAVVDRADLAVHHVPRPLHRGAVRLADALVPEADAQNRDIRTERPHNIHGDARLVRRARSGRNDDLLWPKPLHVGQADLVITMDIDLGTEFTPSTAPRCT